MSPSAKRPKDKVVSEMQDEKLQDKISQPVCKAIERNRLKMVLRNLSLLKLLKSSNRRIQELHSLARRCWNSVLRVPKMLRISSGDNACNEVKKNNEKPQEARFLEKKLETKKEESIEESKETRANEWKPEIASEIKKKEKESTEAVPLDQVEPEVPRTSGGHGLNTRARVRQLSVGRRVIFLKTNYHRSSMGDMKQLDVDGQNIWFEGLPRRIHLPGPRVMCRPSSLRWVKRCCTRFCSASLELPMYHSYKVGVTPVPGQGDARGWRSRNRLDGRVGRANLRVYK
ncbi:TP53-target gene 5 protein [Sciurus carolinensis]|uniref:TP53-target gene 5 protein n=1 Tax=Sciurus carolinensis TaxID=30640 RepID=UPI001FB44165|nr:TP53-target gene 5 protein [Sciurus carolinensis]